VLTCIPIKSNNANPPQELVVRGEVFINIMEFDELNYQLEKRGEKTRNDLSLLI